MSRNKISSIKKSLVVKSTLKLPFLGNTLYNLLLTHLLKHGKKQIAVKIVLKTFRYLVKKTKLNPNFLLEYAISKIFSHFQLRLRKISLTSTARIPILVPVFTATNLAIRWLINSARTSKKRTKTFSKKLAHAILNVIKGRGSFLKYKRQLLKDIEINSAFLYTTSIEPDEEDEEMYGY
jgi:small subunit ribosomal protein S7